MSEEVLNVSRDTNELPILDLTHLDPVTGITQENVLYAAMEQGIDMSTVRHEVRLPQPSSDGQLVLHDRCFNYSDVDDTHNLTKVYGLNKVTTIGGYVFNMSGLSGKIWIDSCTSLGEMTFFCCNNITEIVLNPNLETIPNSCFAICHSLSKVYNLNKIKNIGGYAFSETLIGSDGKVWIDSCTTLGDAAFSSCGSLTEIVLNPNLETIPVQCFLSSSVEKIYNLNKIKHICGEAFGNMENACYLTGKIWIDSCTQLDDGVTFGGSIITEIVLSPNLEKIPNNCFRHAGSLEKVYNLNKVKNIGEYAFSDVMCLAGKIWIDGCTSLGVGAFTIEYGETLITDIVVTQSIYDTIKDSLTSYAPESVNWIPV